MLEYLRSKSGDFAQRDSFTGIGFGMGEQYELIKDKKPFKAVYSLDENTWNGNTSLQLRLRDLKD